jgi:hypothetical protein
MEERFAAVIAFLLNTIINTTGETFEISADPAGTAPSGSVLLGTTGAVQTGVLVLRISTGVSQTLVDHFVGHWTASGG